MNGFSRLVGRFFKDESGVFAVLFGVMAIVLIALGGAVVDYVWLEQTKTRAQVALDAAALALQPQIFDEDYDEEAVRLQAEAIMLERIGDNRIDARIDDVVTSVEDGSLYFSARFTMPTIFVSLVGVPQLSAAIESEATRKKLALEVVMVLDNSGSMQDESRMTRLVEAAKCATYILMYSAVQDDPNNNQTCIPADGSEEVDNVKIGIVPFTMFVNVGTGNANASWIDTAGTSPVAAQNFDDDDTSSTAFAGPVDRLALFDDLANEDWRGCVEARPHRSTGGANEFLDTDDTPATAGDPATLFVPLFSPDMPLGPYWQYPYYPYNQNYTSDAPAACQYTGTCRVVTTQSNCTSQWSNCSTSTTRTLTGAKTGSLANGWCSCNSNLVTNSWQTGSGQSRRYHRTQTWTCNNVKYDAQGLSDREKMERLCKYDGATVPTSFSSGPNADCTRTAILPMTDDVDDVISTIGAMQAEGGTNIHMGAVWGFRALSPTEPFAEGAPYDEATSKVLIVMTDGENTAYNLSSHCYDEHRALVGNCYYSAYGWPSNDTASVPRMGPAGTNNAGLVAEMNARTLQTCANAKAEGITVYTIGLATDTVSQSTPEVVRAMLTNCASTADRARFPEQSSDLKATFEAIANDLSALRLAR